MLNNALQVYLSACRQGKLIIDLSKFYRLKTVLFFAAFILLCILYPEHSLAQDSTESSKPSPIRFSGYIKDLQLAEFTDNANNLITGNIIHNRLNFKYYAPYNLTFTAEERNLLYYGEIVKYTPNFNNSTDVDNGYLNLSKTLVNSHAMVLHSQFDRLNLTWNHDNWDITAGRQRINWGIAMAWNPNDLFNAYNLHNFDYEERPGSDAIRVQRYFGGFSSLEIAAKPGRYKDQTVAAAMYKFNAAGYDFQVLSGLYNKLVTVGAGWAGNIKDAGFKGEISYFRPKNNFKDTTGNLEISISLDQSFNPGWYVSFSALYNSQGQLSNFNLATITTTLLDASNLFPFRYSLYGGVQKTFSPILSGNFSVLYAPGNNAFIFLPSVAYSISNNWNMDLIGQSFFASLNNKFQTAGNDIYLRIRCSF